MNYSASRFQDYSLLLLRLIIAFIFLFHGIPKALNWPMAVEKFVSMGFPGLLGPITGIVEVVVSALIILGLLTKWSSLVLVVIMAGAIAGVQIPASLEAGTVVAGLERDLMLLVGALVLIAFGPGVLSLELSKSTRSTEFE